jgi:S1-C subfamily serine protease
MRRKGGEKMKAIVVLLLLGLAEFAAGQTNLVTFKSREGRVYDNVRIINVDKDGIIWKSSEGMGKIKFADLPEDLQRQYGYDPTAGNKSDLANAIATGLFREVDGVVYDLRKPQPGWTRFSNVKLINQLEDSVLIDPQPNRVSIEVIHVKNLTVLSDTERLSFVAKLVGNFSYINKAQNQRVVRSYDAGRRCQRDEIPDEIAIKGLSYAKINSVRSHRIASALSPGVSDEVRASGTGFFITEDGYLITNNHVVRGANKVKVRTRAVTLDADLVKTSATFDLAVLKVTGKFKPLSLDFDRGGHLGDAVFTIGFPNMDLQGIEPKYTDGKISSLSGMQDDPSQYQISVPVQPGNSGGPLIADNGCVVGIVRAKINDFAALASSGSIPQNVNYAVKVKYLRDLLETIPGLMDKIKAPSRAVPTDEAIKLAQEAAALILLY